MELTVQNVYGLLLRSKLMPAEESRQLFERWQKEAADAADLGQFARFVVGHNYLTEYQFNLLSRGHADSFFLNQYKILDRLGKGRMAGVYKAVHELGQIVAIKVLPPSKAKDPQLFARFQREARLALLLKHPNIVRAYHVGEANSLHYLVMEYLEGEPLEDALVARGKFPPGEAVRLAYQILLGLQHIHEQGMVHRDLKPSNLMLVPAPQKNNSSQCRVKILDIGLGRALFDDTPNAPEQPEDAQLTSAGVLLGTPDYMSPEQARDARSVDIRSDIYSAGCVLYHLLAGQTVFPDSNIITQMIRHATEPPRPLKEFNPAVPDGLQQIINWMLAKEANKRYPTPERAAQALEVFLEAGQESLTAPEVGPSMRTYLNWLEKSEASLSPEETPTAVYDIKPIMPPPPTSAVAAATTTTTSAVKTPPPSSKSVPAAKQAPPKAPPTDKVVRDGKKAGAKGKKGASRPAPATGQAPASGPSPPATPAAVTEVTPFADFETPPMPSAEGTRPAEAPARKFRLTWRDLVMFSSGALGTALAILFAYLLKRWLT